jgi:hypothetical protein
MYVFSILNILFTYDTVTFGFLSGGEWPPKKTNLWISSRETNLWISSRDMNFLTVFMTSYFCDVILTPSLWHHMTSYFCDVILTPLFCDVILTPSLWRHIFVTSFWRRHYDVSIKRWQKLARGDFVFDSTLQALHSRLSSGEAWKFHRTVAGFSPICS